MANIEDLNSNVNDSPDFIRSSIDNRGENEFADDESNIVGKSEDNSEEDDQKILKTIKKEISKHGCIES